jgi:formyltetrahydrofolate synthetase
MGQNTAKLIKQFGAGTGLSDADREYATKIAGGSIKLDEKAIRKVLEINDRAARNVIAGHNKKVENIKTNIPLKVEVPGAVVSIKNNAEYNALPPGTVFIDPEGKQRRKP